MKQEPEMLRWSNVPAFLAAGITCALGFTALVGWRNGDPSLIQIHPVFVPIEADSGLAFVVFAAGLLALTLGRRHVALACGVMIATLAIWGPLQAQMQVDLGIARLFFRSMSRSAALQPGHMGPCAAVCFLLAGSALALLSLPGRPRAGLFALQGAVAALFVLSMLAFFGQSTGFMRFWGREQATRLAPHEILTGQIGKVMEESARAASACSFSPFAARDYGPAWSAPCPLASASVSSRPRRCSGRR